MKTPKELMIKVFAFFGVILLLLTIPAISWGDVSQKPEITVGDAGHLSLDAILADTAATSGTITVPAGRHTLNAASDRTVKAGVTLRVLQGAVITIPTGRTLILAGPLASGIYQIFNCVGTGKVVFHGTNIDMYPEWWGAKGDGSDDLIPFNHAVTSAKASDRANIWLSKMYLLSDTLSINDVNSPKINVIGKNMYKTGIISKADGYPAIELMGNWQTNLSYFTIRGNSYSDAPSTLVPSVALLMGRSSRWNTDGDFHIHNLRIDGYYQYGEIYGSDCSMVRMDHIYTATGNPTGAANKRKFAVAWVHLNLLHLKTKNASWYSGPVPQSCDNNHLSDSAITHGGGVPANSCGFYHNKGGCRYENVYVQGITSTSTDLFCLIDGGNITARDISDESNHRWTWNISSTTPGATIANITSDNVGYWGYTGFLTTDANSFLKNSRFFGPAQGGVISLGGGAESCYFDIPNITAFTVVGNTFIGNHVKLPNTCGPIDLSGVSNSRNNTILGLGYSGTNEFYYDGNIVSGGTTPTVTLDPIKITKGTAAPTSGSWAQGSVIWNTGVSAGGSPGWVCVKSNTFGTLNSGKTSGNITAGAKTLVVNSIAGLAVGNFIDIAGVAGTKRVTNINGTTITLDSNANATVAATAVSFHNETTAAAFKAMANVAK